MQETSDPSTWPVVTWVIALSMALSGGLINWLGNSKSIKDGQMTAAQALGMTKVQAIETIILPQALLALLVWVFLCSPIQ